MTEVHRPAILALEDGRVFNGRAAGAITRRGGEVVFNTSLTGYQEVFTDPSYAGQIVCLTYPHIGNVGANVDDEESSHPHIESLIVREFSQISSNWRSSETAQLYLNRHKIPVIWDIDTRALVRHIRKVGALRGMVSTDGTPAEQLIHEAKQLPSMAGQELASRVSCAKPYDWSQGSIDLATSPWTEQMGEAEGTSRKFRVVAYDFGIKQNILRLLNDHHCEVGVVPAKTSAEDILGMHPDGVFLSNGPGDPEPMDYAVENVRKMMGRVPVFGICLGHQVCGLALGGKTYKLKFGHHGSNHPVKNLLTSQIEITAQNHGFCVDPDSLKSSEVEVTHINLNDQTNEGIRHKKLPLFSVQYHPEASPGPHDSHYLFTQFTDMMKEFQQPGSSRR
ncbi:MAG: glutamine-hydrolyzing carbamoyl-phosphate synthase small subunit [Acidobacteria bacterium]|nr:glutamine-hydrolyzing carbamoyl-phosphate synthase small subunit [Acidobacteriota bacterium]MBS1865277.1 glutamine-hydrolyzing carbamoyl-phosphate synthase small subunit [Acidobacteriota bacterium]